MIRRLFLLTISVVFLIIVVAAVRTPPTLKTSGQPAPLSSFFDPMIVGEIASFEARAGLESLNANPDKLDVVNVFFYDQRSDGSVVRLGIVDPEIETQILALFGEQGPELMLGIGNDYQSERLDLLLTDEEVREKHIRDLVSLVEELGYDGAVLDFENLRNDQTSAFTAYVRELTDTLHRRGKRMAVSLNSKLEGRVIEGIDILEVSRLVDRIEFNAYEEFGNWAGPGPVASIGWVDAIVRNLIAQGLSPSKIVLGTAHNGHDRIISPGEQHVANSTTRKMLALAASHDAELVWDERFQTHFFTYTDQGRRNHIVWLEEARSFERKYRLAKNYGLGGIALWFLGGEDPEIWEMLQ